VWAAGSLVVDPFGSSRPRLYQVLNIWVWIFVAGGESRD
jgi:hypothetical protein